MFRHFGSFSKLSYEQLHRLAKLDKMKLNDSVSGNQTLDQYENYISSSNGFLPEPLLINQIQKSGKFDPALIKAYPNNTLNLQNQNRNIDAPSMRLIINLIKSKEFEKIKSILSSYHYSKFYYPIEYRTIENSQIQKRISDTFESINFYIEELGVSGWIQVIDFFYYHLKHMDAFRNTTFKFNNSPTRRKKLLNGLMKSNFVETCKFINMSNMIFSDFYLAPEINAFFLSQINNSLDELSDLDLIDVLIAYPAHRGLDHDKYFPRLIEKYELIPSHLLIDLMVKMKDVGYKIPIKLINRIDKGSLELFYNSTQEEILTLLRKYIHIDMVSYQIIKSGCFVFFRQSSPLNDGDPYFYRFFKIVSESKHFNLLLKNSYTLMNIIESASTLETHQHLIVITKALFHLKDYSLVKKLNEKLKSVDDKFSFEYATQIINAQKELLELADEKAVFNYQYYTYRIIENSTIRELAKILNNMIYSITPNHDLVYQFYYSNLSDESPASLLESIKFENLHWARLLWHTKDNPDTVKIAETALNLSPQSQNAEYLYYLTTIAPCPIDLSSIPPSNFSLALSYNISKLSPNPTPSHPSYPSIIQFSDLPTEAIMKTIVKLVELNNLKQIKPAIELIGFIPATHPKFSSSLIKDLIKALSELNPSLINVRSVKVHLMKAAKEFSPEDLKKISKFLIYLPKNIIHEFTESFNIKGKLYRYDDEENIAKCKEFVEKLRAGKLSKNIVHELKVIDFFDFGCKEFILGILNEEGFKDDENMKLKIILEIIGNTSPDKEIQEKVVQYVNKFNLWDQLNFQDMCNFCLAHSKFQVFLPTYIYEKFLSIIYAKVNVEEKYRHPINNLICLKPFKYTTVLDPRILVSNNSSKRPPKTDNPPCIEIPYHEVENNIKALAYINTLNLPSTPDINESVNIFFRNRSTENSFLNEKLNILEDLTQIFGESSVTQNFADTNSRWVQDFHVQSQNLFIKVLHKNDYYITSDFKFELKYLTQMMIAQVKQKNSLVCINPTEWNLLTLQEKQELISLRN